MLFVCENAIFFLFFLFFICPVGFRAAPPLQLRKATTPRLKSWLRGWEAVGPLETLIPCRPGSFAVIGSSGLVACLLPCFFLFVSCVLLVPHLRGGLSPRLSCGCMFPGSSAP